MKIKPVYENKKAPCFSHDSLGQHGCPAINDIPGFLYALNQKNFDLAFKILKRTNPFSGGCGRFCDHPCESACNRGKFDSPVNIRDLERFVSDYGIANNLMPKPAKNSLKKQVAIIGAGPAGLSAGYFLKQAGFSVDVFEKEALAGGMMAQGIPVFRYPTEILNWEIDYIKALGVKIHTNHPVGPRQLLEMGSKYDYLLIASGAHRPRKLGIEGEKSEAVITGLEFLKNFNLNEEFRKEHDKETVNPHLDIGEKVAVIGGGYTAIDVARSAARLGKKVTVYYRRSEADLGIHPGEVAECQKEGIEFRFYLNPGEISPTRNPDGTLDFKLEKMLTGEVGADGKSTIFSSGEFVIEKVDTIIKAIGETPDLLYLPDGYEIISNRVKIPGIDIPVYIAGDARYGYAPDVGMVVRAIGSGRISASEIIQDATGKAPRFYNEEKIAWYPTIKTRYFKNQARTLNHELKPLKRKNNFNELIKPLDENEAIYSASRCFYCGICIGCDWCFHYSGGAIAKLDKPWSGSREESYFKFINEKLTLQTREAVEACPRNAMGFSSPDKIKKTKFKKEQYTSYKELVRPKNMEPRKASKKKNPGKKEKSL